MRSIAALGCLAVAVLAGACHGEPARKQMGLLTTLPIYWPETHDIAGMLREREQRHWARTLIEQRYAIRPLDTLSGKGEATGLGGLDLLLLAQPRALLPQENVALDDWVKRGGHVLLFADPLLTAHSEFALGDKRRPQDVALLSPLLTHWGLSFRFDDQQPSGERAVALLGEAVPVDMAGQLANLPGGGCTILAEGLAAECRLGKGKALVVADAALLDQDGAQDEPRAAALAALIDRAFAR